MKATIALLPGDGIGPEVTAAAVTALTRVGELFAHEWTFSTHLIGGAALTAGKAPLPQETSTAAAAADAVFLGAVGDPRFDDRPPAERPESALLRLRRELGVYANLRPARAWAGLDAASPLKPSVIANTDLVVVRELTGGLYYGQPRGIDADGAAAHNTMRYSTEEIARIAHVAFKLARSRRRRILSVDKANVLEVSRLWRQVVTTIAREYADVTLTHEFVDAAAMRLVATPADIDVLLTENLFGDILSDEAGAICGSLGLLPSASLGDRTGLFEPVHGSAPTIAGRDIANPIGAIASAAMLLADGLGLRDEGAAVVAAIERALGDGLRTIDLQDRDGGGSPAAPLGTAAFAAAVCERIAPPATRR